MAITQFPIGTKVVDLDGLNTVKDVTAFFNSTDTLTAGTIVGIRSKGFAYRAVDTATATTVANASGQNFEVLIGESGRANILAFGFVGDDSTLNDDAMARALASGLPLYVPLGVFRVSVNRALPEGADILGIDIIGKGTIKQVTNDTGIFSATDLDYFAVRGIKLQGAVTSLGDAAHRAINIVRCKNFDIDTCVFDRWPAGSGVRMVGTSAGTCTGRVRWNHFEKGDPSATNNGYGNQDNAAVQVYEYCKDVQVIENTMNGPWYCDLLFQDRSNKGGSAITGLLVSGNIGKGAANYGIICYTLDQIITAIEANADGEIRVTSADHGFSTGDLISLNNCGEANGVYTARFVSADIIDLQDSVFTSGTLGSLRNSLNCSGRFIGNHMEDVLGSREFGGPGVKPYGMGLYLQGVGGITGEGNTFLRTNQQTNSEQLSPGSIGINGASGDINLSGGWVSESGYQGIVAKTITNGPRNSNISISHIPVSNSAKNDILVSSAFNVSLDGISIERSKANGEKVFILNSTGVSINNIKWPSCPGIQRAINLIGCKDYTLSNCAIKNVAPASALCELVYIDGCDDGVISANNFDGGQSPYPALTLNDVTNTPITGNRVKMTGDAVARPDVSMQGVCTGTIFDLSNHRQGGRPQNTSTGGLMMTRDTFNLSGGKTRQQGDVILHTDPTTGTIGWWHKVAASAGGADWESATIA